MSLASSASKTSYHSLTLIYVRKSWFFMVKMIFAYATFFALFLSTRITPVEAVAVPKTDLIELHFLSTVLAQSIWTTPSTLHLLQEVTDGTSSTSGNKPTQRRLGCRAGKNERRRHTGCTISVLVANCDNCPLLKQVFEQNLVKIKISKTAEIPGLKRFSLPHPG